MTIHRQDGLRLDGKHYAWNPIGHATVIDGRFKVTLGARKKHETPASAIPNVALLCRIIGVKLQPEDLAHLGWL